MIAIPKHCYAWQLVYSHDVIENNDNFNFLDVGEKLPPVLLRIMVALLNKYLSQNIKFNNFFINIKSLSTFVKLVDNSALKKTILSRMWRNLEFPRDRSIFFWLFLFLFVSSFLVCVVSVSKTWAFASNLKELVLSGLPVSSISSGAMSFVSKSFINLSISSSLSLCTASNNMNPWSVEVPPSISKCLFWLFIFQLFTY